MESIFEVDYLTSKASDDVYQNYIFGYVIDDLKSSVADDEATGDRSETTTLLDTEKDFSVLTCHGDVAKIAETLIDEIQIPVAQDSQGVRTNIIVDGVRVKAVVEGLDSKSELHTIIRRTHDASVPIQDAIVITDHENNTKPLTERVMVTIPRATKEVTLSLRIYFNVTNIHYDFDTNDHTQCVLPINGETKPINFKGQILVDDESLPMMFIDLSILMGSTFLKPVDTCSDLDASDPKQCMHLINGETKQIRFKQQLSVKDEFSPMMFMDTSTHMRNTSLKPPRDANIKKKAHVNNSMDASDIDRNRRAISNGLRLHELQLLDKKRVSVGTGDDTSTGANVLIHQEEDEALGSQSEKSIQFKNILSNSEEFEDGTELMLISVLKEIGEKFWFTHDSMLDGIRRLSHKERLSFKNRDPTVCKYDDYWVDIFMKQSKNYLSLKFNPADMISKHWGYQQIWKYALQPLLFWKGDPSDLIEDFDDNIASRYLCFLFYIPTFHVSYTLFMSFNMWFQRKSWLLLLSLRRYRYDIFLINENTCSQPWGVLKFYKPENPRNNTKLKITRQKYDRVKR